MAGRARTNAKRPGGAGEGPIRRGPGSGDIDLERVRAEFPALKERFSGKRLVYLDSACSALKSRAVAKVLADFYARYGACGGKRSTHLMSQEVEDSVRASRAAVARWLNAESPNEIVFTSGTTEGVNLVARGFPYEEGRDEVVVTALEHNSVFLPFYQLAREGRVKLKVCPVSEGQPDLDSLERLVGSRTALVAMARSSNVFGGEAPVAVVAGLARRHGAKLLLDDAQYLSSHREDVQESQADFVAFSAHKLGGPYGTGVLYGKEHLLNRLVPYKVGGGTVKDVVLKDGDWQVSWLDAPQRLEAGVPNPPGIAGLAAALERLEAWGMERVRAHAASLVRRTAAALAGVEGVRVLGLPERLERGAIVSFAPARPDFSTADFNLYLNHELGGHFIAIRAGEHCAHVLHKSLGLSASLRASFFAYNTPEEADLLVDAVKGYLEALA